MPELNWIGKKEVVKHHQDVPTHLLEPVAELSCGDSDSGNLIVQGDNLIALKALLPRYAGKVKCIYIDPPYNTGNEGWAYNDNVNSPEIKKWLGKVVGAEAEDLSRHDKWLCMMYPRLVLLKQFLREDGVIFVSIDDNEQANLKLLMDEIFGAKKFVGQITWLKKRKGSFLSKKIISVTEYVLAYSKCAEITLFGGKANEEESQPLIKRTNAVKILSFPDNFVQTKLNDGIYDEGVYGNGSSSVKLLNKMSVKNGIIVSAFSLEAPFIWTQENLDKQIQLGARVIINTLNLQVRVYKIFEDTSAKGMSSLIDGVKIKGTNEDAYEELIDVFGKEKIFDYSKPSNYLAYLVLSATYYDKDAIILDSFAGSGTTAHAVLKLNQQDDGNRKFVLVEMDENIAKSVTAERNKRVIEGYENAKGEKVAGLGGGFQFCHLSDEPLFTADGQVRDDVTFAQLASYVWFNETKMGYEGKGDSPLLGVFEGRAIYLLYNGILKDKKPEGGNVLTRVVFDALPTFDGQKVIYAAACAKGVWIEKNQIVFKQTPYALES